MALVLAAQEGESIYIGDRRLVLEEIVTPTVFKVRVEGPLDCVFTIRTTEGVEILPDVFLSAGNTGSMTSAKLVFEAPRDKVILRERLYQRGGSHEEL